MPVERAVHVAQPGLEGLTAALSWLIRGGPEQPNDLRATLAMFNEVRLEFDWGTSKLWTQVTGEKGPAFTQLVDDCHHFDHLILETTLFRGEEADNTTPTEITAMEHRLRLKWRMENALHIGLGMNDGPEFARGEIQWHEVEPGSISSPE